MRSVLVYGGSGALGREVIAHFKAHGWSTTSVDLTVSEIASKSVVIPMNQHWGEQLKHVQQQVHDHKYDVIYCAAGGWSGGSIKDDSLVASVDRMLAYNLLSAISCGAVAAKTLAPGGLLVFTGAAAVLGNAGTGGMIAYGVSKAATHQLIASLANGESGGLPPGACVAGLCPITLDTIPNRTSMPNADHSSWTPLSFVADTVMRWAEPHHRPANGSLHKLVTRGGQTTLEVEKQQ